MILVAQYDARSETCTLLQPESIRERQLRHKIGISCPKMISLQALEGGRKASSLGWVALLVASRCRGEFLIITTYELINLILGVRLTESEGLDSPEKV